MKGLICFIIGVLVGAGGHYYLSQNTRTQVVATRESTQVETTNPAPAREMFSASTVKEELEKTGRVIREKTRQAGTAIADATANATTTATIKSKLLQDSGLAAFKIDVDTTDGVVTLSGTVKSHDEIARAVDLAFQTEGVRKVISTLQIKP
jgi:osmotically-inducible protein OsmY